MAETLWDSITEFLSPEAGQRRRAALDEFGRDIGYYVPPEMRGLLGFAAEMTPTATLERAGQASQRMFDADRTATQRVGDLGAMLSETAGVVAPMMVAPRAGMTAAQAVQEGLLGASVAGQGAGDALAKPVMAAGRSAADIARRIEVDPNALGSMGGNIRLKPQAGGEFGIHKSNVDFKDIDLSKSADNTFWMASPDADWSNIVATGSDYSHQFEISPKAKLATWDDIDKYSVDELEARGFDGVRMDDGGGDVTYQIWNTDILQRLSPPPQSPAQEVAGLLSSGRANDAPTGIKASPLPAPRNDAEAMARDILEMRAAGRAGDVTDEMMAQADPQYMFANTPLPMDEASRMARAGELDAYHGTTASFPAFDNRAYAASGFGTHMGAKEAADSILKAKRSPYSPADAPAYVEGSQVLPLRVDAGPMLRVNDTETWNPHATQFAMAWSDDPAAVAAYERLRANPDYPKFGSDAEQAAFMQNALEREGFGGFVYDNAFEGGGDSYAVFNPANIRSRFARFDPEFRHLRNLSAGVAGGGLLAAQDEQQQREDEIRQYLGGLL